MPTAVQMIRPQSDEADGRVTMFGPRLIDYGRRAAAARGLYRVFNAAGYRFYRSNISPPAESDAPFATSTTLPYQPANLFADGTWYLSVSYFNGVIDSGFLPLGPRGETHLVLTISAGALVLAKPSGPLTARLKPAAGGVIQIIAAYFAAVDGANAASQWSIAYTTDGTTPAVDTPTITPVMQSGLAILAYDLPAQANGTVVKVQLQTRRHDLAGYSYSAAGAVLVATVSTAGPSSPLG